MKHLILTAAAAGLTACATTAQPAGAAGPEAGIGQTAAVNGLRIRPLAVVEDSRCPINARCVWAGRIIVRVVLRGRNGTTTRDLTLGETVAYAGRRLALISAEPSRLAGAPTPPPRSYRFAFSYER